MLGVVSPGGMPPERRSAASSNATRLSGLVETGGGGATATPQAYGYRRGRPPHRPARPRTAPEAGPPRSEPAPPAHGRGGELAQRRGEPRAVARGARRGERLERRGEHRGPR